MKRFLYITGTFLFLSAGTVSATHLTTQANEFFDEECSNVGEDDEDIAFVCDLRERISNIELLPGPQGDPGPQGVKGDTGDQGLIGLTGLQGDQGTIGLTGLLGLTGLQGLKGDTGDAGPQGIQGDGGDQGATGATGPEGPMMKMLDTNGTELGALADRFSFFHSGIERFVSVNTANPLFYGRLEPIVKLLFATNDCTGTAHIGISDNDMLTKVTELFAVGPGRHYVVDFGTPEIIVPGSIWKQLSFEIISQQFICEDVQLSREVRELRQVNLSLSDPLPMPLQYVVN